MEKHVTLVGILHIVYRSVTLLIGLFLLFFSSFINRLLTELIEGGYVPKHEVPPIVFDLIPVILLIAALLLVFFSIITIIGAIGLLRYKQWGRIIILIVSFFSLVRIPLGTILGGYSIWVLLNDEAIALFRTPARDGGLIASDQR